MKTLYLVLLILCGTVFAEWIDFGYDAVDHSTISVIESTPAGMVIDVVIPCIGLTLTFENGLYFVILNIPGATMSALEP